MEKPNLALIGCGYWGNIHKKTLCNRPDSTLVYICDLKQPSEALPEGVIFVNDYNTILRDKSIEGIIIATPTFTHYDLSKRCLEAGKNVLVEKPLTTNSKEALELCQIADNKSLILITGEIFRFNPALKEIKRRIDSGELGNLRFIDSRRVAPGPIRYDVSALWDLATHDVYISNLLVGDLPTSVSYSGISFNGHIDDVVTLILKYGRQNVISTINVNWIHPVKERKLFVAGSKKALCFDDMNPEKKITIFDICIDYLPAEDNKFKATINNNGFSDPIHELGQPLELEQKEFIRAIVEGTYSVTNNYDGLNTVRILEAAEESKRSRGIEIYI
ncbi:Gfo/Idh/MocA family oxidoreductase [Candidatus Woesearchaeota archaeon]|nr:Gfo/Idh/MocA family oxidoreductase [Candidatus Woesearchaeota archaeon]